MPATQLTRPEPKPEMSPRPGHWAPASDEERELARKSAAASLARSRRRIEAWLSVPCPKHHAKRGERCIPFVGGVCRDRIERSKA